jgi:1-deoxy-D-xylulose-5-phosphate reductoisomerase
MKRRLALLGSTGSIGRAVLDVVSRHMDRFEVVALAARGSQPDLLIEQINRFSPSIVSVGDRETAGKLRDFIPREVEIVCGDESLVSLATLSEVDTVIVAVVGVAGLKPTYAAASSGKVIALANKESLVAGGALITAAARRSGARLIPIDSEHSAIFQCIEGHRIEDMRRMILTASGGPFWRWEGDLSRVKVSDALRHPTWSMGKKITIDSATMMNKGLEVIEASWLFGVDADRIDIVIHPESIIHSMVEYKDGAVIALLSLPDMRGPISFALGYPERLESGIEFLDFGKIASLSFYKLDEERFPMIRLVREVIRKGGSLPVVMNAANEVAVYAFLEERIGFLDIYKVVREVVERHTISNPSSIEEIMELDKEGRRLASKVIDSL